MGIHRSFACALALLFLFAGPALSAAGAAGATAPPGALTTAPTNLNGVSATLQGSINPHGLETRAWFEWGETDSYGNGTPVQTISSGNADLPVSADIAGLSLNTGYHYRVVAANDGGTTYGGDVAFSTPPIAITILSPPGGGTIERPDVLVRGSLVTAGQETGVVVNGVPALASGTRFAANHVPLSAGENTITVTATDTAGNTATTAVTVTAVTDGPFIRLLANPESGIAPLDTAFSADLALPSSATGYEIDFDGDGTPDHTGAGLDNVSHVYSSPGLYYATLSVDAGGNMYEDTVAVSVADATELDLMLKSKWNAMKARLGVGDIPGAVHYFAGETKAEYTALYNALSAHLPGIASGMGGIERIVTEGPQAKYRLYRVEPAGTITYYVYFVVDTDGIWRILRY